MKKIIVILLAAVILLFAGCGTESTKVSYNISKEADNFNVMRRLTVINMRTDTVIMQLSGKFSIQNEGHKELSVIVEIDKGTYQKHFVYLNDYTMYTVEDLSGANVSPYAYELEFMPQELIPVRITAHEIEEDVLGVEHGEAKLGGTGFGDKAE